MYLYNDVYIVICTYSDVYVVCSELCVYVYVMVYVQLCWLGGEESVSGSSKS